MISDYKGNKEDICVCESDWPGPVWSHTGLWRWPGRCSSPLGYEASDTRCSWTCWPAYAPASYSPWSSLSLSTHAGTLIYTLNIFCAHSDLHSAVTSYLHTVGNDIIVHHVLYICRFNSTGVWFWIIWSDVAVSPPGFWAFLSDSPDLCSCHRWTYGCSRGLSAVWCTSHWPPWRTTKE